jgi:hypothetical protein
VRRASWAPILVFVGLNLVGYFAARALAAPRPFMLNIDYGLVLLAGAAARPLNRWAQIAVLFLGLLATIVIDGCAIASLPLLECMTRLADYLAFIDLWPWRLLGPWLLAIVCAAGCLTWTVRRTGPRDVTGLVALLVLLAIADLGVRWTPLRAHDLLSSSSRMLVRGYLAFQPSRDDVIAIRYRREAPETLMSISMEALGLYRNPQDQARLIDDNLIRPLAGQYEASLIASHAFSGLTLQGEFRELCGLSLKQASWTSTELPSLRNCLPNALDHRGYATQAFHGNTGRFYGRIRLYPSLGFGAAAFLEDMPGLPRCRPDLFNGVCDAAVLKMALAAFDQGGPRFVHVVTLDAHEPLGSQAFPQCRSLDTPRRDLCAYDHAQSAALSAVAQTLKNAKSPPDLVILYGDHAPPLAGGANVAIDPSRTPYIELRRITPPHHSR